MPQYLLAADLDQIQSYIFGTDRMRTIRGASALVARLGENIRVRAGVKLGSRCKCLRHQGGQYVFIVEEPEELDFIIRQEAQKISGGGVSATTSWLPYPGDAQFAKTMAEVFDQIKAMKTANQRGDTSVNRILGGSFIRHCDLCKQNPATPDPEKPEQLVWSPGNDPQESRHLCLACWKRKRAATDFMELDEKLIVEIRKERVRRQDIVWPSGVTPKFPADTEEIWPAGQEGRLLGIVMADGDGIGQILDRIPSPELYSDFAQAIERVSLQAAARAICEAGLDQKKSGWIELLPIIYGGDDFTFFLPAEKALTFALNLGTSFKELAQNNPSIQQVLQSCFPDRTFLTLSLGVAAAKPSFPFVSLRKLATELRRNAKRQRVAQKQVEGMIDFAMITSANTENLSEMRLHSTHHDSDGSYELTAWPYTLSGLHNLLDLSKSLVYVPRSQRKFLYSEFWRSRSAAESAYRALIKKKGLVEVRNSLKLLGCKRPDHTPFRGQERDQTVLLDALELAELVDDGRTT